MTRAVVRVTLTAGAEQAQVESRDGSVSLMVGATAPLRGRMCGAEERYFIANVAGGAVDLLEDATREAW